MRWILSVLDTRRTFSAIPFRVLRGRATSVQNQLVLNRLVAASGSLSNLRPYLHDLSGFYLLQVSIKGPYSGGDNQIGIYIILGTLRCHLNPLENAHVLHALACIMQQSPRLCRFMPLSRKKYRVNRDAFLLIFISHAGTVSESRACSPTTAFSTCIRSSVRRRDIGNIFSTEYQSLDMKS